ncbi:MAG: DUF1127 domain-containing protein [Alphaproteobacteria bacterium]|nr:DUF1127 domain-containing protein [Alphaproteobacteria bacterium]
MTLYATNSVPFGAFEIFEIANKRPSFIAAIFEWNAKRITRKALAGLSVSQMEDIGLNGAGRI